MGHSKRRPPGCGGRGSGKGRAKPGFETSFEVVRCPIMDDRTTVENCKVRQSLEIDKEKCSKCRHRIDV